MPSHHNVLIGSNVRPHKHRSAMLKQFFQRLALFSFAAYGAMWTAVESISAFIETMKPGGWRSYATLVVASLAYGLWKAWPARKVEIGVPNSDSSVNIQFGDLLKMNGCIAIQVNEYFDSLLGNHVSTKSLHGIFIRDVLGGQSATFDSLVRNALSTTPFEVVKRKSGNTHRYRIGTTAAVDINSRRFLLFAFARTDLSTLKAQATIHDFWEALSGLWEGVRVHSNGENVYVPLLGSGLSGVGLPERQLLELMILSFFYHSKKNKIAKCVTIVVHSSLRAKINLLALKAVEE